MSKKTGRFFRPIEERDELNQVLRDCFKDSKKKMSKAKLILKYSKQIVSEMEEKYKEVSG